MDEILSQSYGITHTLEMCALVYSIYTREHSHCGAMANFSEFIDRVICTSYLLRGHLAISPFPSTNNELSGFSRNAPKFAFSPRKNKRWQLKHKHRKHMPVLVCFCVCERDMRDCMHVCCDIFVATESCFCDSTLDCSCTRVYLFIYIVSPCVLSRYSPHK